MKLPTVRAGLKPAPTLLLLALLLLLSACETQETPNPDPAAIPTSGAAIAFTGGEEAVSPSPLGEGAGGVRPGAEGEAGILPLSAGDLITGNIANMTVYAHYTGTDDFSNALATTTPNFMFAQRVDKSGSAWSYTPLKYWPRVNGTDYGKVSFFALAPAPATENGITLQSDNYTGYPAFTVTPPATLANQLDLCVAQATDLTKNSHSGKAPLTFAHTMAKVTFAAKYTSILNADVSVAIQKIEVKGVYGSSALSFTAPPPGYTWGTPTGAATYTLENAALAGAALSRTTYTAVSTDAGTLMLVPQTIPSDAKFKITYCVGGMMEENREADMTPATLDAGKAYNYTFTLTTSIGEPQTYTCTGAAQTFTAPTAGTYLLEVWGAGSRRAHDDDATVYGKGGYSSGKIALNAGDKLYVYVGERPAGTEQPFNGGGKGVGGTTWKSAGGGGATDIRITGTTLYHRLIVAGGAGGGENRGYGAGHGGGLTGVKGGNQNGSSGGNPGTQIAGGASTGDNSNAGSFGTGGDAKDSRGGAGGGGWYGGSASDGGGGNVGSGGGGSGWVYTEDAFNTWQTGNPTDAAQYELTSYYYLTDAKTVTGNVTDGMPDWSTCGGTMTGNAGNGFARITRISD